MAREHLVRTTGITFEEAAQIDHTDKRITALTQWPADRMEYLVRHAATENSYGRHIREAIKLQERGTSASSRRQDEIRESYGSGGTFGGKHSVTASAAWLFTMMNNGNLPTEQQLRLTAAYASSHRYSLSKKTLEEIHGPGVG